MIVWRCTKCSGLVYLADVYTDGHSVEWWVWRCSVCAREALSAHWRDRTDTLADQKRKYRLRVRASSV